MKAYLLILLLATELCACQVQSAEPETVIVASQVQPNLSAVDWYGFNKVLVQPVRTELSESDFHALIAANPDHIFFDYTKNGEQLIRPTDGSPILFVGDDTPCDCPTMPIPDFFKYMTYVDTTTYFFTPSFPVYSW